MELKGKVAVVTGGGTGLGYATTAALVAEGARVMIAGRRKATLQEATTSLRKLGGDVNWHQCDVRTHTACVDLVDATIREFGSLDVLVNNAGVLAHAKKLDEHTEDDWDRVIASNLKSAFFMSVAALPHMVSRKSGYVVMMSSISGVRYYPNQVLYGLSKHGMNSLVEFIMCEYAEHNIHAVAVCPGIANTEMAVSQKPVFMDALLQPEHIAAWIVFALKQPDIVRVTSPIVLATSRHPWTGVFR